MVAQQIPKKLSELTPNDTGSNNRNALELGASDSPVFLDITATVRDTGGHVFSVASYPGADPTGATDSTAAAQAAHDDMPANGGVLDFGAGTWKIDGLNLSKSTVVQGAGRGATILKRTDGTKAILSLSGSTSKFIVRDLEVDGNQLGGGSNNKAGITANNIYSLICARLYVHDCGVPGYAAGHSGNCDGIYVSVAKRFTVRDSRFERCERDGLISIPCDRQFVENCEFVSCGRYGASADTQGAGTGTGPLKVKYIGNEVESCGAGGLHAETDSNAATATPGRVYYAGNTVKSCGYDSWGAGYYGLTIGSNMYGQVCDNHIEDFAVQKSLGRVTSGSNQITSVTVPGAFSVGDGVAGAFIPDGTTITAIVGSTYTISANATGTLSGNRLYSAKTYSRSAIFAANTNGPMVIRGNTVKGCGDYAIGANSTVLANTLKITGNVITSAGQDGINVYLASGVTVVDNTVDGSYANGISLTSCLAAKVISNNVQNSGAAVSTVYAGLQTDTCANLVCSDNDFTSVNQAWGIGFNTSTNWTTATMVGNRVGNGTNTNAWFNANNGTSGGDTVAIGAGTIRRYYGTAVPTTGAWRVGDRVENTTPAAGGNMGWICTTAGTPGTWKTYGAIAS